MMERRIFGRTGHASSIAIFGAAAFWDISPSQADAVLEQVAQAGVNHIDVAPSYGMAEERLGPWLKDKRENFFLGCKTMERGQRGSWAELQQSLKRLQVHNFDLYQIHAVGTLEELDNATRPGGVIETMKKARQEGLTRYIGITGHGQQVPRLFIEALNRFDFDSVLFPLNFALYARDEYRRAAQELISICRQRNVGRMVIKSIAQGPWNNRPKTHTTWYQPFSDQEMIQKAVNFALSQDVTGICTVGDTTVLPMVLNACKDFKPMGVDEQEQLIQQGKVLDLFF
jgi:aryl-alcohol dehydrogenase-like predicted oxidoreductase